MLKMFYVMALCTAFCVCASNASDEVDGQKRESKGRHVPQPTKEDCDGVIKAKGECKTECGTPVPAFISGVAKIFKPATDSSSS